MLPRSSDSARQWLAFRRFAARELRRPAVDPDTLGDDPARDFLKLALLSMRALGASTTNLRRADGMPFRLVLAYLDSAQPNAFAAERRGIHFCGVHVGLAASFLEFALFCFSQASLFPDLGDPAHETSPPPLDGYPPGFWMREKGAALEKNLFLETASGFLPRCPHRALTAVLMTVTMIRFVWFHELCHCVNGHMGWMGSRGRHFGFTETDAREAHALAPAMHQCLELDADQSAFHAACRLHHENMENIEGLRSVPGETSLRLCLFACFSTAWIIQEYAERLNDAPRETHPLPYIRLHNLMRTLASNTLPAMGGDGTRASPAFEDMSRLSLLLPSFPSGHRLRADMGNTTLQDHLDARQDALQALRADLRPYRFT
ncbi:hypothetical protein [Rhodospirillum sp. A1_3_36]|uniref:hypothetical protein n=1 Tax=Rhodospirillum sp. A1_3_36 TaxID=3391666 RepID=UPI0039A4E9DE